MKNIVLLPFVIILSACTGTGDVLESSTVVIEEKGVESKAVDAIVRDESNFNWSDLTKPFTQANNTTQTSVKAQALAELKASDTNFTLYFSYDGTDIGDKATQEIIKHANFMRDNPAVTLRLEGHADERGTREYNLALGENRALSVKEVLSLYEGLEDRIKVVSFGEENPMARAHDESGWGKNRRVEFIYK
ncbi:MAG TPA: flagellar motor protein MotB [Gammaproteobacteria bacterium]|nr:flagellar motor protein MotB [Gammaproteobacteria bacterium]